jgi:hypothetical protein
MSGELGLKNTFKDRVYGPLQEFRGAVGQEGGREISLEEFMATRAMNADGKPIGLKNMAGAPITQADVWNDLGLDPSRVKLGNILALTDDMKYLAPEIVRSFILKGLQTDASYMDLVAGSENVSSLTVTTPWIKMKNEEPVDTAEAETIAEADMTWGEKTIRLKKKAKAIHMSDELLLSTPLPLLSYFLQKFGVMLSAGLYTEGLDTMINGDQVDGSDATAIIGTATGTSTAFKDFLRAWVRARRIFVKWDNLVNNEETAYQVMQIPEFFTPQGVGGVVVTLDAKNRIIPTAMPHFIGSALDDGQSLLFDKAQSLIYLSFRGLMVESERIIMRQIQGTACSLMGGFATIDRTSRVIMDGSLAFSSHGFPSYMTPLI